MTPFHKLGKITPECLEYWPDAKYVQWSWWRFIYLKEDVVSQHCIDIWGYRHKRWCGRLWWCTRWLGCKSTLFNFERAWWKIKVCTLSNIITGLIVIGLVTVLRWIFKL